MTIRDEIEARLPLINNACRILFEREGFGTWNTEIQAIYGKKFARLVTVENSNVRSAFGFVLLEDNKGFKAGDIMKASSWAAPAMNFARGSILSDDGTLKALRSWTGVS